MENEKKLVKTGEAAEYLMISEQTLRDWHRRGKLVPAVVGKSGHRRYTIQQLREYKKQYYGEEE